MVHQLGRDPRVLKVFLDLGGILGVDRWVWARATGARDQATRAAETVDRT
jgi:hypothetical protein